MIPEHKVVDYWERRASEQGARTVGFGNRLLSAQDEEYKEKSGFVQRKIDGSRRVLDYGCGIGRHTHLFAKDKYRGVDITHKLLAIAEESHPDYDFSLLSEVGAVPDFDFEVFFTSTVLQHNSDDTLDRIFGNAKIVKPEGFQFLLYENSQVIAPHVKARCVDDHVDLISRHFRVKESSSDSHVVHGQRHDISVIEV